MYISVGIEDISYNILILFFFPIGVVLLLFFWINDLWLPVVLFWKCVSLDLQTKLVLCM